MTLLRSDAAPAPRTLVEVLEESVDRYPGEVALDDGTRRLTYAGLRAAAAVVARRLAEAGIGPGDRVGVRLPSGSAELYVGILGVLAAGACYVPVDADDPQARADTMFAAAGVAAVLGPVESLPRHAPGAAPRRPAPGDDAWVIFTSGSTGAPKGVAVTHRSAAALVDAEARWFLSAAPIGPGDRVLAGLSVAFDASCEEMWLAWRHGATLVPAPRSLVRSGMDLGPWLVAQDITVVSTVPTLAALWPAEALDSVRLLIFGGETCPPELVERLAVYGREVWNTYGPTEATVVSCGARLEADGPVRIGLPLDGWDLAVVDATGTPVPVGTVGELVIAGVGLARYLDPVRDAERFAPLPSLGWERAYRSGDLVRFDGTGLVFVGRTDEQVKLGGRRIELGEVDAALQALPGVAGAAAAVRRTTGGHQLLVGYVVPTPGTDPDPAELVARLRAHLPAPLVPQLALVEALPVKTSGKVDRDALPWPLAASDVPPGLGLSGTAAWVAEQWADVLGTAPAGLDDDFFLHGGGSLAAAQLVAALRERFGGVTVADVYDHPRLGALAQRLDSLVPVEPTHREEVRATPRSARLVQTLLTLPLQTLVGLRWVTWLALGLTALDAAGTPLAVPVPDRWWVAGAVVVLLTPIGRMLLAVALVRPLTYGVGPGTYPRGGGVHLRLWTAEQVLDATAATAVSGAPWVPYLARALGAQVGRGVDLHTLPPVTGLARLGRGCSIEPEVDLSGWWLDGDRLVVGAVEIGAGARVGTRSTLLPGARIGRDAVVAAGSAVHGSVPAGQWWSGSPARRAGRSRTWPGQRPATGRRWVPVYATSSLVVAAVPVVAAATGVAAAWPWVHRLAGGGAGPGLLVGVLVGTPAGLLALAVVVAGLVRLLSVGVRAGYHPVRSRTGWQVWTTLRLLDEARTWLFPLYSSLLTPSWLRLLGARVGSGVEASTVLLLPAMTTIGDGAFLADDTMVASYELGGGWMRVEPAKVGKRAFLGNSGMTGPGRRVRKHGLVAVLSAAPERAKPGSSWLGSPPVRLRRSPQGADEARTFAPSRSLVLARAAVEAARVLPVMLSVSIGAGVLAVLGVLAREAGWPVAAALSGVVLVGAGWLAAAVTVAAKWVLVHRHTATQHPLWSAGVWRDELADTFVEVLAAPWFARARLGTPALLWWLRALGASIGRGVWCDTYWLPEPDLVRIGAAATVNRGCVVQTHLFHDRVMAMDVVTLEAGASLGPHSVVLPAARLGAGASVGPASLVMRGDVVPPGTRWVGNPIAPWHEEVLFSAEGSGP